MAVPRSLQPIAGFLVEQASEKLGGVVSVDVMRPLQTFDARMRARSAKTLVDALLQAKEAGVDPSAALRLVDWG